MRPAREITHARRLNGAGCKGAVHDLTCNLVTAGIRDGQVQALRWARRETLAAIRRMTDALDRISKAIDQLKKDAA